ncbi:MAG: hypothetical protein JNM94_15605 [Phycisphaerae bacterium]|nr:hypothetical protein [Phycisphaerae bacterium]
MSAQPSAGPGSSDPVATTTSIPDPPRTLPWRTILVGLVILGLLQVGVAEGLARWKGWGPEVVKGIALGGAASLVVAALAILVLAPWKPRKTADWTVLWLGVVTVRLIFTPLALFSVYSSALLPGPAVFLGGVAAYLAALLLETVVIARAMLPSEHAPTRDSPERS